MMSSPQVPTRESRGDGGDVPEIGWREETFDAALASQSMLGWGLAMWRCGRCVASHSVLDWGDSLLSVAGRCLGESIRAWLGTIARWPVSPRMVGDCGYVASQSALGWGLSRGGQETTRDVPTRGLRTLARPGNAVRSWRGETRGVCEVSGVREWMARPGKSANGWRDLGSPRMFRESSTGTWAGVPGRSRVGKRCQKRRHVPGGRVPRLGSRDQVCVPASAEVVSTCFVPSREVVAGRNEVEFLGSFTRLSLFYRLSLCTFALISNVRLLALLWSVSPFGSVLPLE
ncbi:hypothetical protein ACLB2K_019704 [Fragaria x ananassa]